MTEAEFAKGARLTNGRRSLVLVHDQRYMDPQDFVGIAERIRSRAPEIRVFLTDNQACNETATGDDAPFPSLVVCPFPLERFKPRGGKVYQGQWMGKIKQLQRFDEAGVPTPKWTVVDTDTRLDPATWGPVVVVKPEFGFSGRGIRLVRTEQVGFYAALMRLSGTQKQNERLYAQCFVDTGDPLSFYRVLSFFSETMNCHFDTAPAPGELADIGRMPAEGVSIAVNNIDQRCSTHTQDSEILDFARRVHGALEDRPVLGIDVVRDRHSGKLFVLEANPSGHVWHLSSKTGLHFQQTHGYDDYEQFDALTVAAEALIKRTRAESG